jgi:hypothetical protein
MALSNGAEALVSVLRCASELNRHRLVVQMDLNV